MIKQGSTKRGFMAANLGRKRVTFGIHAPDAREVAVAGTFNNWDPTARLQKRDKEGKWESSFFLPPGKYEYRFVIDGIWFDDSHCTTRSRNQYGGEICIVEVK